ncbi:MAG: O-acetyl-ADP-ribose deacetylase [Nostocoides sp.]
MVTVEIIQGDITTQQVDAIVNAANSSLLGGGGVDGAIHAAAGPQLRAECRRVRRTRWPDGLPVGEAVATGAGRLAARWVIHTVGPNWHRGQRDPADLASCFTRSVQVAQQLGVRSMALPAVSAGVYGWPGEDVARIAIDSVRRATDMTGKPADNAIQLIRFVLFSPRLTALFERALASI